MGTSFTSLDGFGFWSHDTPMCGWMLILVHEMDQGPSLTEPQQRFRDDLHLQARICVNGAVVDCLDHVSKSRELRSWAISVGKQSLHKLQAVDGQWLNSLSDISIDAGNCFPEAPIQSDLFTKYGQRWIDLLSGDYDPLPVLPTGKFHATGEIEVDVTAFPQENRRASEPNSKPGRQQDER